MDWKTDTEAREAELAVARERGPAHVVDLQWRRLREQAVEADYSDFLVLLDAAASEPRLRQLFPFTSMWVLCFSSNIEKPSLAEAPAVVAQLDGRFEVKTDRWGDIIGETDSAHEAIALVVANLPERLGPAGRHIPDDLR
ncbi:MULTISPECIES: DUF6193 family natural product biosynthesis protein [Streptomyces]|uniref:Uncharacterized protein n=2 Tax=Streptomyces TaxID=1883 RepID=A0A117IWH1_9ACTN|nr:MULTISPECIES: DUF6193 family natural product biosynthesis protein [Streptomyces]KUH38870.1 hypothetical protein ATE80_10650 [Streptomyces kanasensis]UUS29716.1 DUF6193 family natural product biosynthesis protein [Streptomyces changanensis]